MKVYVFLRVLKNNILIFKTCNISAPATNLKFSKSPNQF